MVDLSVVIPAYNEAERLPTTLARIHSYFSRRAETFEVLVVDDGSDDGTSACTAEFSENFRSLVLEKNFGKGAATRTGVLASRGKWVLLCDADLSAPIEELEKLEAATVDAPIVFGSRALDRSLTSRRQPFYREFLGRGFNVLLRGLGVRGIRDTQCGFKLLEGQVARELFSLVTVQGFAFDVELLLLARKRGIAIKEVAVVWNHVEESRVHPILDSVRMLVATARTRWRLRG